MIIVSHNNKEYKIKSDWSDVTLSDMAKLQSVISKSPKTIQELIKTGKDNGVQEEEFTLFKRNVVLVFSDLPKEVANGIALQSDDGNDLQTLFNLCCMFMFDYSGEIKIEDIEPQFEFKGIKYRLIENVQSLSGVSKLMSKSTFEEYIQASALFKSYNESEGVKLDKLGKLLAVLYRPVQIKRKYLFFKKEEIESFDEEKMSKRAELFNELTMDKFWKAYFFFTRSNSKLLKDLQIYSKEISQKKQVQFQN